MKVWLTLLLIALVIVMGSYLAMRQQVLQREIEFRDAVHDLLLLVDKAVEVEKTSPSATHCSQVGQALRTASMRLPDVSRDRNLSQVVTGIAIIASSFENRSTYLDVASKLDPIEQPTEVAKCEERAEDMFKTIAQGRELVQKHITVVK